MAIENSLCGQRTILPTMGKQFSAAVSSDEIDIGVRKEKDLRNRMMKLRDFKEDDAQIIAGWIRSEEELYKWSADRFNQYPLSGEDINENYAPHLHTGRFIPLTAVDNNGDAIGHFIIRYPRDDDDSSVRFGFVIIDPA